MSRIPTGVFFSVRIETEMPGKGDNRIIQKHINKIKNIPLAVYLDFIPVHIEYVVL